MEYLEGQTLGHLMRSIRPMPIHDALKIAATVCEALDYMHGHDVVHRDLKPDNIMICNDGSIRIMDFGIAKLNEGRRLTFGSFQPALGTPDYMAPEQVKGKRGDVRTDIYSLGAILYEMVTGQSPFTGDNPLVVMNARLTGDPIAPSKLNPQLLPQVEEIILKAMARDPSERYASAKDLQDDLKNPGQVRLTNRAEKLIPPSEFKARTRSMWIIVLAIIVPLAAAIGFLISSHLFKTERPIPAAVQPTTKVTPPPRRSGH